MSEPTGTEQNQELIARPTTPIPSTPATESTEGKTLKVLIAACSAAIIGCFFLPWIPFLFDTASGFQIQQLPSDHAKLVWVIPCTAILPLFGLPSRQWVAATAGIAGVTPFAALVYYLSQYGSNLLSVFQIGAYLTFLLGAVLIVLAARLSNTKP